MYFSIKYIADRQKTIKKFFFKVVKKKNQVFLIVKNLLCLVEYVEEKNDKFNNQKIFNSIKYPERKIKSAIIYLLKKTF